MELCDDPVVEKLVVDIATGFAHVGPTIELCRLLKATGRGGGGVDLIASLGGANVQNVHRDLNNLCQNLYNSSLTPIIVPLTVYGENFQKYKQPFKFMLPIDILHSMYEMSQGQFEYSFIGQGGIERFIIRLFGWA